MTTSPAREPESGGVAGARDAFPGAPGYLDTATYGLPPTGTVEALRDGVARWQHGTAHGPDYDAAVARSRELFAALVGADPADVAVANQVSVLIGLIAAAVRDGARVLAPEQEFASVVFPFLAHADRGVTVRTVPLAELADAVDADTDVVAFSAVQSLDGRVADIDAVAEAAACHGAVTLLDVTQAVGWLPVDAARVDYLVAGAYKWLLAPRGSAFLVAAPPRREELRPLHAGWYAGDNPWTAIYGEPLRLAGSARRFDVSPAWLVWEGTAPALETIAGLGVERIHAHNVALANALRARPRPGAVELGDGVCAGQRRRPARPRRAHRLGPRELGAACVPPLQRPPRRRGGRGGPAGRAPRMIASAPASMRGRAPEWGMH